MLQVSCLFCQNLIELPIQALTSSKLQAGLGLPKKSEEFQKIFTEVA